MPEPPAHSPAAPATHPGDARAGAALAAFYFAFFAALGAFGPFVAVYLAARGFSPADAARLLALMPLARVVVTPLWTWTADHVRSAGAVVRVASAGAIVAFALLAAAESRALLVAALVAFTVFRAPVGALTDSLALAWVERSGGDYGRVRAWGTVGFMLSVFATGALVEGTAPRAVVWVTLGCLVLGGACLVALPEGVPPARAPLAPALRVLLSRPRMRLLVVTGLLHQVGLAAYDALFPLYLSRRAGGRWAGVAVALGAACEVAVMARGRPWLKRLGWGRALALAYAASALRWLVVAYAPGVAALVAVQALHALTFGAYYLAAVAVVHEEAPEAVRSSAQGIYQAAVFGVGSAAALALAAWLDRAGGMRAVFLAGAVAAALAAALAGALDRPREAP